MMPLLVHLALAITWMLVTGDFTFGNLVIGLILGYFVLLTQQDVLAGGSYTRRFNRVVRLVILFLYEVVVSSLRVAREVVRPRLRAKPAMVAIPLDVTGDFEILAVAGMVSLTPGTLSVDVSEDRRFLFVHAMDAREPDEVRDDVKGGIERWVMEVTR
jgi:multicomponent Na+:H+ antiporter subunit E